MSSYQLSQLSCQSSALPLPILISHNSAVIEVVTSIAHGLGIKIQVAVDYHAAQLIWHAAALIIIDNDQAESFTDSIFPTSARIVVLADEVTYAHQPATWKQPSYIDNSKVITFPSAIGELEKCLADLAQTTSTVIGIIGACGGAGATVFAASLGMQAADDGLQTVVIDADPLGSGIDLLIDTSVTANLEIVSNSNDTDRLLNISSQSHEFTSVFNCIPQLVENRYHSSDVIVIDLPRSGAQYLSQLIALCDVLIVVMPAEIRASISASRVIYYVEPHARRLECIIRGPIVNGVRPSDIAALLGIPLTGFMPAQPDLATTLEKGISPLADPDSSLGHMCRLVLDSFVKLRR